MARVAEISDPDMYAMWVACGRNATQAARRLGIEPATFQYHARTKNYNGRYAAEFAEFAEGYRRIALIEAYQNIKEMLDVLKDIATDDEAQHRDRINAAERYLRFINDSQPIQPRVQIVDDQAIEATIVDDDIQDAETYIKRALEANIIDASESRTKTKN